MIKKYIQKSKSAAELQATGKQLPSVVENIVNDVAARGDAGVVKLSDKFDKFNHAGFKLNKEEIEGCLESLPPGTVDEIRCLDGAKRHIFGRVGIDLLAGRPTGKAVRYTGGLWMDKPIKTRTCQMVTEQAGIMISEDNSRWCVIENIAGHKE
ncbi:MAG: histidinol dehydrogenase [Deltaproteobacteria bacterium]|nr:histidinol dehydrogenase [Deltaproteobacteria bacterium]